MGAPSKLRLGGKARTLRSQSSRRKQRPLRSPWTGSSSVGGLGWESRLQSAQSSVPHPFCFFLRKGWETTNLNRPLSRSIGFRAHGCPIQAPLGWESTNSSQPVFTEGAEAVEVTMDRVLVRGWSWVGVEASIRTKLRAPSFLLLSAERVGNHKPQSTIVAKHRIPRPWVPHVSLLRHGKPQTSIDRCREVSDSAPMGAPSKLRLGGKARTLRSQSSRREQRPLRSPWTGSSSVGGLGWESRLQSAQSSVPHPFCFFLRKGWETTNLNRPLSRSIRFRD